MASGGDGNVTCMAGVWLMKQREMFAEAVTGFFLLLIRSGHLKKSDCIF